MREAPIGPLPDYFVAYMDSKGDYVEVNFEIEQNAMDYIHRLKKKKIKAELWTRIRVFPESK